MKTLVAIARLLRVSNAPTAVADVWMGYAVATGSLEPSWPLVLLSIASLCIYHGGMALNDVVDSERDAADGRGRPIEQGTISRATALVVGEVLFWFGLCLVNVVVILYESGLVLLSTCLLFIAVTLYNSSIKRTVVGPFLMGACRAFNGLLGMATEEGMPAVFAAFVTAPGVGAYVTGVTLFARDESKGGRRGQLAIGIVIALSGIAWLAAAPYWVGAAPPRATPVQVAVVWGVVALVAVRGMAAGVAQPTPRNIGRGVGIAIQGIVVIDAVLAGLYAGPVAGMAVLALLPLTMILARFVPQS